MSEPISKLPIEELWEAGLSAIYQRANKAAAESDHNKPVCTDCDEFLVNDTCPRCGCQTCY